ncbi:hypothetical protein GCM10010336_50900 [Streptomyces goshikiensis]|nr:hypothetical protein GCM10010336_50900 [Streptomyces goshikiensis]
MDYLNQTDLPPPVRAVARPFPWPEAALDSRPGHQGAPGVRPFEAAFMRFLIPDDHGTVLASLDASPNPGPP